MKHKIIKQIKNWTEWSDWKAMLLSNELGVNIATIRIYYLMINA